MKTIGLCTHFTANDEWAFDYAFKLARQRQLTLNICHWLESPYTLRRDLVYPEFAGQGEVVPVTPQILNQMEMQLRQYYQPKLADFTDAAFKLCEGSYQVELVRCFRQHLLDLVVMGYQPPQAETPSSEQPMTRFAQNLPHPVVIVGADGPNTFLLNAAAYALRARLDLPKDSWQLLDDTHVSWRVLQSA